MKRFFLISEFVLLVAALVFAVLWATVPERHFDSLLGIATTLLLMLEVIRRFALREAKNPFRAKFRSCGDVRDLLNRALRALEEITQTDYNQIFLNNQSGHQGRLLAVADSIPDHKQRYRVAIYDGLLGSAYSNAQTINSGDVRQLKGYFPAVPETRSELVAPVKADGTVLGVINSESEEFNHFTDDVQAQVEQLAVALGQLLTVLRWDSRATEDDIIWIQKTPTSQMHGRAT